MKLKKVISMLLAAALVTGLSVGGAGAVPAPEELNAPNAQEPAAQSEEASEDSTPSGTETETQTETQAQPQSNGRDVLLWMLRDRLTNGGVEQAQIDAALEKAGSLSEDELRALVEGEGKSLSAPELLTRLGVNPPAVVDAAEPPATAAAPTLGAPPAMDSFGDADSQDNNQIENQGNTQTGSQDNTQTENQDNTQTDTQGNTQTGNQDNTQTGNQDNTQPGNQDNTQTGNQDNTQTDSQSQGAMDSFPGMDEPGTGEPPEDVSGDELPPEEVPAEPIFTPQELEKIRMTMGGNMSDAEILEIAAILSQDGLSKNDILAFLLSRQQPVQTFASDSAVPTPPETGDVIRVTVTPNNESPTQPEIQINPYNMNINNSTASLIIDPFTITSKTEAKLNVTVTASVQPKGGVNIVSQPPRGAGALATNDRNIFLFMEYQDLGTSTSIPRSWTDPSEYTDAENQRVRIPEPGQSQSKPLTFTMDAATETAPTYAAVKIGGDCSIPISPTTWKDGTEGYYEGDLWIGTEGDGVEVTVIFDFSADETVENYKVEFWFIDYFSFSDYYNETPLGTITVDGQDITGGTSWPVDKPLTFHCDMKKFEDHTNRVSAVYMYYDKDKEMQPGGRLAGAEPKYISDAVWGRDADKGLYAGVGDGALPLSIDLTIPEWTINPGATAVVIIQGA